MNKTVHVHGPLLVLAVCLIGCSSSNDHPPAVPDEAKRRADAESPAMSVKEAAEKYFLPDYAKPGEAAYEESPPDYFRGMDQIVAPANPWPSQLSKSPHQGGSEQFALRDPDLSRQEVLGRNTWMMWCAGNEGFWDWLATDSLGFIDLLSLVDSRERSTRFDRGGLINEPQMIQAVEPDEFGLWLDLPQDPGARRWRKEYVQRTFEEIAGGYHESQRGLTKRDGSKLFEESRRPREAESPLSPRPDGVPPPEIYGLSSGVIGLRLFPNPYFNSSAQRAWNADRYYNTDDCYSDNPRLVRPYRVGVTCAYCHASFHPLQPPKSLSQPEWTNLSGSIGAQYLRIRVAFGNRLTPDQFVYHLLDSQPPGTIDTSLIASDNINNPNTMNAVFNLRQRVVQSFHNPPEMLHGKSAQYPSIWRSPGKDPSKGDAVPDGLKQAFENLGLGEALATSNDNPRRTPRVLLDGSDSVGPWLALARVYLNIGSNWEQWNQVHQPVVGFTPQRPFEIADCESRSVYWNATGLRVGGLRDYFLKVTPPMPLLATENGKDRWRSPDVRKDPCRDEPRPTYVDPSKLDHGRRVFAHNCIVCHSSIQPESLPPDLKAVLASKWDEARLQDVANRRKKYREADNLSGEFWEHDPGKWLADPDYRAWAEAVVEQAQFWNDNYLSTDYRVPVTLVGTNSSRAMATNAVTGHVWEDFASSSYRNLPSVGPIPFFNPYLGEHGGEDAYLPRHVANPKVPAKNPGGGGPGYYRVPTLISIWATAPLLHNNSLGVFNNDPSVDGRLKAFDDAIRKLLWPEKRLKNSAYNGATPERLAQDHGLIWRTTQESYLTLGSQRVPYFARKLPEVSKLYQWLPWLERIDPPAQPCLILLGGALLLLTVQNPDWKKYWRNFFLAASVGLGAFALARLALGWDLSWAPSTPTLWIDALACLALAVSMLAQRAWIRRAGGYAATSVAALLALILYFESGRLGEVRIGPIPAGTPVNLLANFNPDAARADQVEAFVKVASELAEINARHLKPEEARRAMREEIAPALMAVNKCPDFVMDKGHYFEWFVTMSDEDKEALIELLKTF